MAYQMELLADRTGGCIRCLLENLLYYWYTVDCLLIMMEGMTKALDYWCSNLETKFGRAFVCVRGVC